MKTCTQCGVIKPAPDFVKNKSRPDGLSIYCKVCSNEQARVFAKKDPDRRALINRRSLLKRLYNLTLEQYDELFNKQNGCCAICRRHQSELSRNLSVEHNHQTGEIRALTCDYCNRYLIGKHTEPEIFRRAAHYLETAHTGWYVPEQMKRGRKKRRKRRGR